MTTDFDNQSSYRTGFRVDLTVHGWTEDRIARLRRNMHLFRLGDSLPQDFIDLHEWIARDRVVDFAREMKVRVHGTEMVSDGWMDGMKVLRVIAEDPTGGLRDFRWSAANGGSWFEKCSSGGQSLVQNVGVPGHF